ncbi:hypothetical protein HYW32_00180 [Candidatus Berkelbacteria bacterium]|nr:hypothetical protein [Candidatus Berkelbacteria bacterium]
MARERKQKKPILVILEDPTCLDRIHNAIHPHEQDQILYLPLNDSSYRALQSANLPSVDLTSLQWKSFIGMDDEARKLARISINKNKKVLHGQEITQVLEWPLSYLFAYLLKRIWIIDWAIRSYKPGQIIFCIPKNKFQLSDDLSFSESSLIGSRLALLLARRSSLPYKMIRVRQKMAFDFLRPLRLIYRWWRSQRFPEIPLKRFDVLVAPAVKEASFSAFKGKNINRLTSYGLPLPLFSHEQFQFPPLRYRGISLNSILNSTAKQVGRTLRSYRAFFERVSAALAFAHAEFVIASEDTSAFGKSLVLAAKSQGIRSVVSQHGVTGHPIGFIPLTADKFMAWGQISRDWLIKHGVPAKRVSVTGHPAFQAHQVDRTRRAIHRTNVNKMLKLASRAKLVVLTTQVIEERYCFPNYHVNWWENTPFIQDVINAVLDIDLAVLVIKPHPSDEGMEKIIESLITRERVKIVRTIPTPELLEAADVVVTAWSTTGLEALAVGTPVVWHNPARRPDYLGYRPYMKHIEAKNPLELTALIRQAIKYPLHYLKSAKTVEYLKDYFSVPHLH